MNRLRFARGERAVRHPRAAAAILLSLLLPWQPGATEMHPAGSARAGPFGLGEVVTSDGWRLDLALALESLPFDPRGGAATVRAGPWRLHARPDTEGVTIVQERAVGSSSAGAAQTRWFSIRARFAPLTGRARPAAPPWLGKESGDHVILAADAGTRVLTAVGWRNEAPADWWSTVSARARAAGASLRRLDSAGGEERQTSEWIAIGGSGAQHVVLTAHPHRGGTGWVLQSLEERS